ncbi:MAG: ABC transporter substrate-binding protein [Deltaproteobacteria bacterium]|nr:ABC transporter substrate-binding protein [Deltaproteobacteria bacterium]
MKRNLSLSILLSICLLFPSAALAADDVPGVTADEVVIGTTVPMSGPAAMWAAMGLGNLAWAQHINDQGGIHGRKIKVILKDDGYNPARALANLKDMKGDVFAYGCVIGSATANAARDFLAESKTPVVHIHANPRMWVNVPDEQMRNLFIAYPDYIDEAGAITAFAVNKKGLKKIALFGQNDDWGRSAKEGIEKAIQKLSGKAEFVGFVPYEITERSLGSHAMKLKELNADAVIVYAAPTQAALIMKEMAKVGYRPKIFTANPLGDPLMYKIAGELWEGAYPAASGMCPCPAWNPRRTRSWRY